MSDREGASDASSPSSSSANQYRSSPNCGKCRNHGIILPLRGHKRNCRYRDCECECCILTVQRRIVMAKQTAHVRQKRLEEKRASEGEEPSYPPINLPPTPPPAGPSGPPPLNKRVADLEEHSYAANELIKMFGLDMNALPFAYAVLGVAGDVQTAVDMVSDAKNELMPRRGSMESGGISPLNLNMNGSLQPSSSGNDGHYSGPRNFSGPLALVKSRFDLSHCCSSRSTSPNVGYSRDPP